MLDLTRSRAHKAIGANSDSAEGSGGERNKGIQYGENEFVDKTKIEVIVVKEQVSTLPSIKWKCKICKMSFKIA